MFDFRSNNVLNPMQTRQYLIAHNKTTWKTVNIINIVKIKFYKDKGWICTHTDSTNHFDMIKNTTMFMNYHYLK